MGGAWVLVLLEDCNRCNMGDSAAAGIPRLVIRQVILNHDTKINGDRVQGRCWWNMIEDNDGFVELAGLEVCVGSVFSNTGAAWFIGTRNA